MDETPPLPTILEHHRGASVEEPCGEAREYTGVWIRQSLPRSIDVKETKCRGGNPVGFPHHQTKSLLSVFVEGINRAERGRLALGCRHWRQSLTVCIFQLPSSTPQLVRGSLCWIDQSLRVIPAQALAVNAHGGRDDQPGHRSLSKSFEQCCGSDLVVANVRDHVVAALADAHGRCKVQHQIYSAQCPVQRGVIGNITNDQLGFRIEIDGRLSR